MKIIEKILRVAIATGLGVIFNKIFSSTNEIVGNLETFEHNIPFIYTLGLVEITTFILGTTILTFIVYIAYHKSRSSQKEIYKIYSFILETEILIGSFIVGTQLLDNHNRFNLCLANLWNISFNILFILFFSSFIYEYSNKSKKIISSEEKLYDSRKPLLRVMDEYLESMSSFSIVGEWGIGKTNLIDNFFSGEEVDSNGKKYKEKYEMLYIDASIYSSNQKIVETIESELNNLFKSAGILKKTTSFIDELFAQNNSFLMGVYQYIFSSGTVDEERKKIEKRIDEIKTNDKKLVVLCLDNLERLNSKKRVIELFAIVNEILPKNVKKIYTYEEKEMVKIFEKEDSSDFVEYMEKYTFNKVEVTDVTVEEILKDNPLAKEYIEKIISRCTSSTLKLNFKDTIKDTISNLSYSGIDKYTHNLENELNKKLEEIEPKLKNPRYVENLLRYLKSTQQKGKEYELEYRYKLEYKIIRDFFLNINISNIFLKEIYSVKLLENFDAFSSVVNGEKKDISTEKISLTKVEQLCFIYLFKVDNNGESINDYLRKEAYFEMFFENKGDFNESRENQKLEELKKNPNRNLIKILNKIALLNPESFVDEIIKYLKEKKEIQFIISTSEELRHLVYLEKLNRYSSYLFPKIKLNKNGEYSYGGEKKSCENYHNILVKSYMLRNSFIGDLIQIIDNGNHSTFYKLGPNTVDAFLKNLDENNSLDKFIEMLLNEFEKCKEYLNELETYEDTETSLETLKNFNSWIPENIALEKEKEIIQITDELLRRKRQEIKNIFEEKDGKLKMFNGIYEGELFEKDDIKNIISHLKERAKENPKLADGVRVVIIELMKFRDKN